MVTRRGPNGFTVVVDVVEVAMVKRLNLDEYMEFVKLAVVEDYKNNLWHPEDLATAVHFANEAAGKILGAIDE